MTDDKHISRATVEGDAAQLPDRGRCAHPDDGMVFACESCDAPLPYKRSDASVADGADRFRCSGCGTTSEVVVERESYAHTRATGGSNGHADEILPDGGRVQDDRRQCSECDRDAVPGSQFCRGHIRQMTDGAGDWYETETLSNPDGSMDVHYCWECGHMMADETVEEVDACPHCGYSDDALEVDRDP